MYFARWRITFYNFCIGQFLLNGIVTNFEFNSVSSHWCTAKSYFIKDIPLPSSMGKFGFDAQLASRIRCCVIYRIISERFVSIGILWDRFDVQLLLQTADHSLLVRQKIVFVRGYHHKFTDALFQTICTFFDSITQSSLANVGIIPKSNGVINVP